MTRVLSFQQVILKLHEFWAAQHCVIWEPYNVQVGAGTGNPATTLRVLGPEPWRVAYVEPSVRPDDGRFGENPNRMQKYYQYQVILKPDPGDPQELYLASLHALGIDPRQHDIRFVEDNWESPALGAWGLGWEVWLNGQEITQFTYFQQAGGLPLDPVSVEITYGIERIVLALQNKASAWDIDWLDGIRYADMMFNDEVEHCRYYFEIADVDALKQVYDTYEREYARALEGDALIAAYDYVLKCSHLFNVLDTRGAVGVTERANYFRRMREMTRSIASEYVAKRAEIGHPLLKMSGKWRAAAPQTAAALPAPPAEAADVLFEIGVEELPADDVADVLAQMQRAVPALFDELRLPQTGLDVCATPRRIAFIARQVAPQQTAEEFIAKGPPADRAFDAEGKPTRAAQGFARGKGVAVADLQVQTIGGGRYATALVRRPGKPTIEVLAEALPRLAASLKFGKSMRWNAAGTVFSRPIRWLTALFGAAVIPFEFAGLASGSTTRGLRPYGSPLIALPNPQAYRQAAAEQGIVLDYAQRRARIQQQVAALAAEIGAVAAADDALLSEVSNLVEAPTAFRGRFDEKFLELPRDVLVTVMRKHQRYFALEDSDGNLLNAFIGVRNGDSQHIETVTGGNEQVIHARFSDARFFYQADIKKPLKAYLPRLDTLTFQADLGSMLAKSQRLRAAAGELGALLGFDADVIADAQQAAVLAKADLATQMVVEMTALQGIMGREYAQREGIPAPIPQVIFEHWLPRSAGDILPASEPGCLLAIADRLDSLVGLFAVGLAPKSNADPYGLRRTALGILQILVARGIAVDLRTAIDRSARLQPVEVGFDIKAQVLDFMQARFANWLNDEYDYPRDVRNAVLAVQAHNPARAMQSIAELAGWVQRGNWETILDSFARCVRMTRREAKQTLDPSLFTTQQEHALHRAYEQAATSRSHENAASIDGFLSAFEPLIPAITDFFDHVLVHADDQRLRDNRIALLQQVSRMQDGIADLSLLDNF